MQAREKVSVKQMESSQREHIMMLIVDIMNEIDKVDYSLINILRQKFPKILNKKESKGRKFT